MNYLKGLVINFLVVFFAVHVLPGIDVMELTRLPQVGGDLKLAIGLGFLNSLIYLVLKLIGGISPFKIALLAFILNFAVFAIIKWVPIGIGIVSVEGYIFAALGVSVGSFFVNFFISRKNGPKKMDLPL